MMPLAITDRFTTTDLGELELPDGWRAEIIAGELYVSRATSWQHQGVCANLVRALLDWSERTGLGRANIAPGVIYADDDNVIPDVVWISRERLAGHLDSAGHVVGDGPELVVEVLSPGPANEYRDTVAKLALYSRRAVREYWIVDWSTRTLHIYRKGAQGLMQTAAVLYAHESDVLRSSLLPGFDLPVGAIFDGITNDGTAELH